MPVSLFIRDEEFRYWHCVTDMIIKERRGLFCALWVMSSSGLAIQHNGKYQHLSNLSRDVSSYNGFDLFDCILHNHKNYVNAGPEQM